MRKGIIPVSIFAVAVLLLIGFIEKPIANNSIDKALIEKKTIVELKAESCKEFIEHLEKAGIKIKAITKGSNTFLKGEATAININEEFVNVYEYKNSDQMAADVKTIRSDGAIVGNAFVDWVSIPHIYKSGSIIVLYVGENKEIKDMIQKSVGNQFAGG
ncbi:hypothetical protein CFOLD11_24380 [Clostridium folliculivorans]|uniref:Uncharacterized protein n=1 Tax=Clostridium folliculivorans TaxID=2886038 RepID=A0A9W5Y2Z7_9CLOT|nr:hypothetical protein [Clostridium folliculivorans]GKU25612.1 hypothetical protein CFOLD11_24380 [Clostridium folliculivorans]